MLPLKLIIEGLYSYRERQIIDFEELTSAGLFGIFGAVGSGKSSILEAISFALYGETERLNARDKRGYNMMNLKSNRFYIEFEFQNHENRKFKTIREFRRNSKNFEDVKPYSSGFYEEIKGQWKSLENSNASDLLGLSYENFKRTIIIPQGQFKEFLELGAKDRTVMMKEIFNLQKFDLQDKTNVLLSRNKTELDTLKGKLSAYETVNSEGLSELEKQWQELKNALEKIRENHEKSTEAFRKLQDLRTEYRALQQNHEKLKTFESRKEFYALQQKKLEEFEKVQLHFVQIIREESETQKQLQLKTNELETRKTDSEAMKNQLQDLENQIKNLKPQFEKLEERKQKVFDFEIIAELKNIETKINSEEERFRKGNEVVQQKENEKQKTEEVQAKLNDEITALKAKKSDAKMLIDISGWYQNHKYLTEHILNRQKNIGEIQKKKSELENVLNDLKINPESFENEFERKAKDFETQKQQLSQHENHLKLEEKLTEFAHALHEGEACPLCGSHEHPNVLTGKDVSDELQKIQLQLKDIEHQIKALNQQKAQAEKIFENLKIYSEQILKEEAELQGFQNQQKQHLELFVWKEFDAEKPEKFELHQKNSFETEQQIAQKEKEFQNQAGVLKGIQTDIERFQVALRNIENQRNELKTKFSTQIQNLRILDFHSFSEIAADEIIQNASNLKTENERIEKDYKSFENQFNDLKIKDAALQSTLENLTKNCDELHQKAERISDEIQQKLQSGNFESKEVVLSILNQALDPVAIRKEIEDFKIQWENLKAKIEEQKQKLKDFDASDAFFEKEKEKLDALTEALQNLSDKTSKTEGELQRLKNELEEKQHLLEKQTELQKREENLKTLSGLFKAQGFVNFISSIYLRQLCDHANLRFHRMTRNQLSLQLNENLDFEIVDYLNEGRHRSVKTLSGGQSFQVSLSLALALAESVQTQSRSDKNFFFIDEGFGTQDSEAVNIVFDTLMQLQQENRIVGIISHVSELKDRMPISLQITKDEKMGSSIEKYF